MPPEGTTEGETGGPSHVVMIEAQKAVKKGGPDQERALLLQELDPKKRKSLTTIANHPKLMILKAGAGTPATKKINEIVKALSRAQSDAVKTAVHDALEADRDVIYNCGVWDVHKVKEVHFHIHVDSKTTTIEICPDLHI